MPYLDQNGNHIAQNPYGQTPNPYQSVGMNSYTPPNSNSYSSIAQTPTPSASPYKQIVNYLSKGQKTNDNPYEPSQPEPVQPTTPTAPTTPPTNPVTVPTNPNTPPITADNPSPVPRGRAVSPTQPGQQPTDPNAKPPGTEDPAVAAQWYQKWIPAITTADVIAYRTHPGQYKDISEWWNAGNRAGNQDMPHGNGQPGTNMSDYWYHQWQNTLQDITGRGLDPNDPKNWPGGKMFDQHGTDITPQTTQTVTTPHVDPAGPNATPPTGTPPATTPPASTPPVGSGGGAGGQGGAGTQGASIADQLRALLQPEFSYEQEQLNRGLNANAAVTGDINSGGFGETVGRAQAQLAGNQGQRMSDYLATASENEKNRGVQYAQIDAQKFIASMQDETQRLGIHTNDQLQRWLNDPNNNTLNKYQIDKQDLLARYQSQLQLQGQQLTANAAINGAALQAAATASAAAQNSKTQLSIAQIQAGLRQQEIENQYNLDSSGQAWQQYMFTHPSFSDILNAYLKFSPEQIAAMGLPPLTFYNP